MEQRGLDVFFEHYLKQQPLFTNKKALQSSFIPETLKHRDEQVSTIANILAPAIRQEKPSNLFIYGKTGTGKTVTIRHITAKMGEVARSNNIPLKVHYINCKLKRVADTEYRLIAALSREFGKDVPSTGLPTDEVYRIFFESVDSEQQLVLLVLDEIDQLVKKVGDEILYNLTRINEVLARSQVCIIGISNDLTFVDNLDPRVKSSLSEEELVFPPYNALQIQDILQSRSAIAFKAGTIREGVIQKCAAIAARDHGDVRRALELLRVAGEIAEREHCEGITLEHLDKAEAKIERDRVFDIITTQPKQFKVTLFALLEIAAKRKDDIFTGEVYDLYKNICPKTGIRPLTQRRISDILAEFDMLGIINTRVISKGRYGRTRHISIGIAPTTLPHVTETLKSSLDLIP